MKQPAVADIARVVSVYKRKGRPGYTLEYLDHDGATRQRTLAKKGAATALSEAVLVRSGRQPEISHAVTLEEHGQRWLTRVSAHLRPQTVESYRWALDRFVLPALGAKRLQAIDRGAVKDFLAGLRPGLSKKSVSIVWGVLRACLNAAREDGLLLANPAAAIGRALGLGTTRLELASKVRALDLEQRDRFFAACARKAPRYELLFRVMAVAGLRPGEAYALQWDDIDAAGALLHVRRTLSGRQVLAGTKTGTERAVDLSVALLADLDAQDAATKAAAMKSGKARPPWIFPTELGHPRDHTHMRAIFARVLRAAELPATFTPHSLRHTYASLLLQAGVSPAYVQEQLGHASIKLTVDLYGRWLRKRAPGAVDALDGRPKRQTNVRNRRHAGARR